MKRTIQRLPWLLCVGNERSDLASLSAMFGAAGYSVDFAHSELEAHDAISRGAFDIAVIDHTFSAAARTRIAQGIKRRAPAKLVLVLHASGGRRNPYADAAVDSRRGSEAILEALRQLHTMGAVRDHRHNAMRHEYVVVAGTDGRYTFVSDGVCALLGYTRAEFMDAESAKVAADRPSEVAELFREIVAQHGPQGDFLLRHRNGSPVQIVFRSTIETDGCVIVWWELAASAPGSAIPKESSVSAEARLEARQSLVTKTHLQ